MPIAGSRRPVPTSRQLQRLFAEALDRVARLHESLLWPDAGRNRIEHVREARVRVQQLRVVLRRIHALHAQETRRQARVDGMDREVIAQRLKPLQRQKGRIKLELGIQAESFYYLAHRATKCIQYAMGNKLFAPVGVRDVRNHLIEHPRALHWDFQYHKPEGVVMKPFRDEADASLATLRDPGLFLNAEEFARGLNRVLTRNSHDEA